MRIKFTAIGQGMPNWVTVGYNEYIKRLPKNLVQLVELPLAYRRKHESVSQAVEQEGKALLQAVDKQDYVIALDRQGEMWNTTQLAEKFAAWQLAGRDVVLWIGGPDGLAPACYERADKMWSLSALTLPHPVVRVILAEALYRAWSLLHHHPYHRA